MKNIDLHSKWENISSFENKKGYKALRISSECIPDLFIATNTDGYRFLLLYLPKNTQIKIKGADKNKLLLSYLPSKGILLIKLKDFEFIDLFNDLIISIYTKVKSVLVPDKAAEELITIFYKWAYFFEDNQRNKLNEEQIQGLFGELFMLNKFLEDSKPSNINSILTSWKGLYDTAHDFEFDLKNVEVKTKKESKSFVKISSEFQLDKEFGKGLELMVVTVRIDLINGKSIHDTMVQIIELIRGNYGELSILYKALNQKGLTVDNLKHYNNYRFIVLKTELFDAAVIDFPKLTKSNIANQISHLRYNLRIIQLDQFLIESKKY
ncbi:PD-(D/E)XK motif protein [Bizionia sp.]|uniref:PD-(D/E)XK motif protein n=1 Tax=Bizionia sp. TaxID=1954480 RepID=UPI003A93768C